MDNTKQPVDEKQIDLTQLKLISRGNQQFIAKMLTLFVSMVPKNSANLNNFLDEADWPKLSDLAHSLKPTIDTLNIVSLKGPIRKLEKLAKTGQNQTEIRELKDFVVYHLQLAMVEAKEILHKMK
jgi:HPt (histidine-containing phosphotransfer) domain-containing protein